MTPMVHTELTVKGFDSPDSVREFEGGSGQVEIVHLGGRTVSRSTFKPGWRWSEHVKSIAGTERCEVFHLGYMISGRMRIEMHDGVVMEIGPGQVAEIPPDHDGAVIGDEDCVMIDFGDIADYAVAHHN